MKKDNTKLQITGMVLVTVVFLALIASSAFQQNSERGTLSTEGEGEIEVTPDLVEINLQLQTKGDSSEEATTTNSVMTEALLSALEDLGLDKEVTTSNFNVYQEYNYDEGSRKEAGYVATHSIVVELDVEDNDLINDVISASTGEGATVSYMNYKISDELQDELAETAYAIASEEAHNKAKNIAEGLGVKLGKIKNVQILDSYSSYPYYAMDSSANLKVESASGVSVTDPESQTVTTRISVTYELR